MKKLMTLLLSLAMVACMATLLAPPASAIVEGDWVTSRAADDYQDEESYRPACGYEYVMDQGLMLISADYTNNTPYTHVHTKKPYDLKAKNADGKGNSVSVQFTVLDFAYGGENDDKDHWVCFSLHSKEIYAPGQTGYGEGVSVLVRGAGKGTAIAQFFSLDDNNGWKLFSEMAIKIPVNEQGQEVYTFEVRHDDWGYTFYLCGQEFYDAGKTADSVLDTYCKDGAYVGMSFYTGVTGSPIEICVNEFQGEVPFGEDSMPPEDNVNNFAPIADSATVPAGQPAVIWDSKMEQFSRFNGSNLDFATNEDGTIKLTAKVESGYVIFSPKSTVSYEAKDFPVIVVLTKNCSAEMGKFYYSAGDVMGAQPNCSCEFLLDEVKYNDGWCLGVLDLTDDVDWQGRINMIRCDFSGIDYTDPEVNSFDVAYIAAFRTLEDAKAYTEAYLYDLLGVDPGGDIVTTEKDTTVEEENPTQSESEDIEQPTTSAPEENKGCGSVIAMPLLALFTVIGIASIAKKE